ncbi:Ring finger domain [seawater metagenome]|uniref:Ring finger domain n=1 Tax=seawater metagenome TaxID=1561972 RepID=A0A5E8CL97_9ZZZZ
MECTICLQELNNPEKLECNHTFCQTCIQKWNEKNSTCPLCRKSFFIKIKQIYNTYKGLDVEKGYLHGFHPTLSNYLRDNKISNCVRMKHNLTINKPFGVVFDCQECKKSMAFNWLG